MSEENALETAEVDGTRKAGSGAGGEEFKPPKDGSWVPVDRLKDVSRKLKETREELARERQKAETTTSHPKTWSLNELNAEVNAGRMTQDAANQIWEDQIVERAAGKVRTVTTIESRTQTQAEELAEYQRLIPDLEDPASPEFAKVEKEYQHYLKHLGMPDTTGTMLVAARAVLGPIEAIRAGKSATIKGGEAYRETGSGPGGGGRKPTTLEALSPRQKEHYRRAIEMGAYAGWDAVAAELKGPKSRQVRA